MCRVIFRRVLSRAVGRNSNKKAPKGALNLVIGNTLIPAWEDYLLYLYLPHIVAVAPQHAANELIMRESAAANRFLMSLVDDCVTHLDFTDMHFFYFHYHAVRTMLAIYPADSPLFPL